MLGVFVLGGLAAWALLGHTNRSVDPDLDAQARDLLRAARGAYPDDPRFATATAVVRRVLPDESRDIVNLERRTVRRGRFDRASGVLHIGTVRPDGSALPREVVRGILAHELAHAALPDGKHSDSWRDAYTKLLQVATERLGWSVVLECGACRFYGVCDAGSCPLCDRQACTRPGRHPPSAK